MRSSIDHYQYTAHYYRVKIVTSPSASGSRRFIHSNSERACIVATLQDVLRYKIGDNDHPVYARLPRHIDLLAFSILPDDMSFVLFSLSYADVANFCAVIINSLIEFQQNEHPNNPPGATLKVSICTLAGPHTALHETTLLHTRHSDWEYDRYSSVGFFLHGRRGDWMHTWKISPLYNNRAMYYRLLLLAVIKKEFFTTELNASYTHG